MTSLYLATEEPISSIILLTSFIALLSPSFLLVFLPSFLPAFLPPVEHAVGTWYSEGLCHKISVNLQILEWH